MEIKSSEETKKEILEFGKEYIKLLIEKKELAARIKEVKDNYKENGVPVQIVAASINRLIKRKKKTQTQLFEEDFIDTTLSEDSDIDNDIGVLSAS